MISIIALLSSYTVKSGFSHANSFLQNKMNDIDIDFRRDLNLKLAKFERNIPNLIKIQQLHPHTENVNQFNLIKV